MLGSRDGTVVLTPVTERRVEELEPLLAGVVRTASPSAEVGSVRPVR